MRLVHINKSDTSGGASVAAVRIVKSLIENGVDAKLLTAEKNSDFSWVKSITSSKINNLKSKFYFISDVMRFLPYEKSKQVRFAFSTGRSGFDISQQPDVLSADIIHLHWFNQGFLSIKGLEKVLKMGKPVVWTLHDMWSFTGGCHYSGDCLNYTKNCGFCHFLKNPAKDDISFSQFNLKNKIYTDTQLFPVTCSNWLAQIAKQSELLKNRPVTSIPNPIDIEIFKPTDKSEARQKLGLPKDKKLILFGAANVTDPRKGMNYLFSALNQLIEKSDNNMELVIFGKKSEEILKNIHLPVHTFNYISNTETLVNLYNATDVFVLPSMEDNLPNTVMEALACGLPVAAFQIGGVPEMVSHLENGYLAPSGDSSELAKGINYLINNNETNNFRLKARQKVETNFARHIIAKKYKTLYETILNK